MNRLMRFVIALALALGAASAHGKTVTFGEKPEKIMLRYGKATVLRFESKVGSVQNAERFEVGPLNEQAPNYAEMSVKPRSVTTSDTVNFLLVDGTVVRLRFVPVTGQAAEAVEMFYELKKRKEPLGSKIARDVFPDASGAAETEDGEGGGKIELMKALILGAKIRGYQIREVGKFLKTGLKGVNAERVRVYAGKDLNGYVFKLVNTASQSKYEIDIRRLKIGNPNLVLMSQVDRSLVEPESTGNHIAYLTIVALPSSLSRDVVLPVSWVKKEEGRK